MTRHTPQRVIFEQTDGVRLVADVGGPDDAPTVILAHGGGQTRHSWSGAFRRLIAEGYNVINFDARGHGESDWSRDNRYPIDRRWSDLEHIAGRAGTPVAVVGASMGGGTALYGVSMGFRPDALVLVDIAPEAERDGMQRVRDFMAQGLTGFDSVEDAADAVAAYNPARPRSEDASGLTRNLRQRSDGRWYWHWDPGMIDLDIDREREIMASTLESLRAVQGLPLLLVRGMRSDVVSGRTVASFKARVPSLEVFEVEGAGHMVSGDRNDAFNDGILAFLSAHLQPGRAPSTGTRDITGKTSDEH